MGFDNDCIVNIQSLAGEYFCAVCRTLVYPNEAIQTPCTHLYCKPCLTYVVSTTHTCPYDGYRVIEADSKPLLESNKTLAETIGKIQVHCLYYRTGCSWEGILSDCTSHCTTCTFGDSAVLCNRCGIQLKHREVQEHAQTCSGVPPQVQQPDNTSSGAATAVAVPDQTLSAVKTGAPGPQATSQASAPLVSSQGANQTSNSTTQPQAAQNAMLTPEQMYQQQMQYQQYYQQYPGYDPYQQNYQYYYQYPQGTQQYQQPQAQAYPQAYVQPQVYGQAQTQSIVQTQQQIQPQVPPQGSQIPPQPAQTAVSAHPLPPTTGQMPHIQGQGQGQGQPQALGQGQMYSQMQAQGQVPMTHAPYNQAQPLPQAQVQPVPQQPQVPQYPHTHSRPQGYPQSQAQHYPNPPPQVHPQPYSQPNPQGPMPQQPYAPVTQPQNPNAVSGYQSYPQPHPQAQGQYPNQMQGQFPTQNSQMRPPQSYANVPNQQPPAVLSAQGQPSSGPPVQNQPVYAQAQQPGYPFQQRPSMQGAQQAVPQQYGQQQSVHAQGPYMHPQPSMTTQSHPQGASQMPPHAGQNYGQPPSAQPNVAQNYASRPMGAYAGQIYGQPPSAQPNAAGHVRPPQSNQNYPMKNNDKLPSAEQQATQSQRVPNGENSHNPEFEKGVHGQMNSSKEARNMAMVSSMGTMEGDTKLKAKNGSVGSADGKNESNLSGSKQMPCAETKVDNHAHEAKPMIKGDAGEGVSKTPAIADKNGVEDHGNALKKGKAQDFKNTAKPAADSSAPSTAMRKAPNQSQGHGANQQQPMPYGLHNPVNSQQPGLASHPSNQFRQEPGRAPASGMVHESQSGDVLGPGSSGSLGKPGNLNYYQVNFPPREAGQSQNPFGNPVVGPPVTPPSHLPGASRYDIEKFEARRAGHFDRRQPDSHPQGAIERTFGPGINGIQPGDMKFGGPSAHNAMSGTGMRDERAMLNFPRREVEDDFRKFPRPPRLEAGPSSKYGVHFPSSGPLDHGSRRFSGDGMMRSFDKGPQGFDRDPNIKMDGAGTGPSRLVPPFHPNDVGERAHAFVDSGMGIADFSRPDFPGPPPGSSFDRHHIDGLPPRTLGNDYPGFPSRTFGPYGDVGANESRPYENSKATHENRFPVPPRGDVDIRGNLCMGEQLAPNQDLMPGHLQRGGHMGNLHSGEAASFGRLGGLSRIEPPLGNFPPNAPFGGEKPDHLLEGEPGFRSGYCFPHHANNDGFYPREMDPFDNSRKQNSGNIMCRICQVECGTIEGLDLHSQSTEHQRKARDMVLRIKQQSKKQKMSKDQASVEGGRGGGRRKNSGFRGRGNKR